jgi:hypothetical protein
MSRRIVYLALAAATLIATPAAAAPQFRPGVSHHGHMQRHHAFHHGRMAHHRHAFRHRHFARFGSIVGSADAIDVPLLNNGGSTNVIVQSLQWFDPSWQLCQIEGISTYYCGPYNYYPYGVYGYRPFGNYGEHRAYRSAPTNLVVPDARVIRIDPDR